jgi:hypothetical protein
MDLFEPKQRDLWLLSTQLMGALIELYQGNGVTAYRCIKGMRQHRSLPVAPGWILAIHGLAALAACRSGGFDRRKLVREVARKASNLRALSMPWTDALALVLDAGVAIVMRNHARARDQLERARAELTAADMMLCAMMARRRLGELIDGVEGHRAITEADAWLVAQGVVSPERLTRVFMPEVA